ncbi:hypothetical protein J6590_099518 [Homalodisca vitripennis]|nr:hypothetical protein J6590_099518 [Homalodisca vitripennis]
MSCNTEEHHKESSDVARHTAGWPHPNMLTWPCPLYYVLRIRTIVSCRARQKNTTRRATHCWLAASQHVNVARSSLLRSSDSDDRIMSCNTEEHHKESTLSSLLRSSDSDDRIMSCNTEEHHKESSDVARHTAGWPHPNMLTWPCPLYYVLHHMSRNSLQMQYF